MPDPGVRIHSSVSLPVHVETVLGWQNGRIGRHRALVLVGKLHLPELRAEIAFCCHNGNGNGNGHAEEHRATATIIPRHFTMAIPLQHLAPPGREDSDVWALTQAPDRDPPWAEHYVGRLEGEPLPFDQYVQADVTLDLTFTPEEGQDGHGAKVSLAGEVRFERSMHTRLLFRDPERSTALPSESDSGGAVLIAAGSRVPVPPQTVSRLAGRDPLMTVRVTDADGTLVSVEQALTGPARRAS